MYKMHPMSNYAEFTGLLLYIVTCPVINIFRTLLKQEVQLLQRNRSTLRAGRQVTQSYSK